MLQCGHLGYYSIIILVTEYTNLTDGVTFTVNICEIIELYIISTYAKQYFRLPSLDFS